MLNHKVIVTYSRDTYICTACQSPPSLLCLQLSKGLCLTDHDFHMLMSPACIEPPQHQLMQYGNLNAAIRACKTAYHYTVVDAPRIADSVAADLGKMSKYVFIVFQQAVKDVKNARSLISTLIEAGVETEKIKPLANRFTKRGWLVPLDNSKKTLGLDGVERVRSDFRKTIQSINRGQPLARIAKRSGLRRDFQRIAGKIYSNGTNGKSTTTG